MHAVPARIVAPDEAQPLPLPDGYRHVEFRVNSPAAEVYLILGNKDGWANGLHRMKQERRNHWRRVLALRPGTYVYRYYVFDGSLTTLVLPTDDRHARAGRIHRFNSELRVPPLAVTNPERRSTSPVDTQSHAPSAPQH